MATAIFVNLPVSDVERSKAFFTALGYAFNSRFTDENATCMIVGDGNYVMLLVEKFFATFSPKPIADAKSTNECSLAISLDSRDAVDKMVEAAFAAGARRHTDPVDYGFMYQWGFEDLDGHIWDYFWMSPEGPPKADSPKAS